MVEWSCVVARLRRAWRVARYVCVGGTGLCVGQEGRGSRGERALTRGGWVRAEVEEVVRLVPRTVRGALSELRVGGAGS